MLLRFADKPKKLQKKAHLIRLSDKGLSGLKFIDDQTAVCPSRVEKCELHKINL